MLVPAIVAVLGGALALYLVAAGSGAPLDGLHVTLLLALGVGAVTVAVAWRRAAARQRASSPQRESQDRLLRLVIDSQPNAIFILDREGRYRFANRRAAREAGLEPHGMIGKELAGVIGPEAAKRHARLKAEALDKGEPVVSVDRVSANGHERIVQAEHIPLCEGDEMPRSVLVVEEDVTRAVTERERRVRVLRQLVDALLVMVDQRDPFAADHSLRVATLARAMAEEMGLDPVMVETAEYAGTLMNLGKILVPEDILTRSGPLSETEIERVRDSLQTGVDLVQDIEFDGPVADTLRQAQERWPGIGACRRNAGEEPLVTARIIAVANAFVAMISARAHRPSFGFDQAVDELLEQFGTVFDRHIVAALVSHLDNHGGREQWAVAMRAPHVN